MKKYWIAAIIVTTTFFFIACGGGANTSEKTTPAGEGETPATGESDAKTISDDKLGVGKFTKVELTTPLDQTMLENGEKVYNVKCASCHKLSDEKLVGPGWKDVTKRRTPEWIMNFSTNTEEMLDKDAAALSMLEICLVKMPNQNLADDEARGVLEYMRKNDGEK